MSATPQHSLEVSTFFMAVCVTQRTLTSATRNTHSLKKKKKATQTQKQKTSPHVPGTQSRSTATRIAATTALSSSGTPRDAHEPQNQRPLAPCSFGSDDNAAFDCGVTMTRSKKETLIVLSEKREKNVKERDER
jgi:hypothetical protein